MTILDEIAVYTSKRMAVEEERVSTASLRRQALAMASAEREANGGAFPFRFSAALAKPGLAFICECKKASPSKGLIAPDFPYLQIAKEYQAAGADAISSISPFYYKFSSAEIQQYYLDLMNALEMPFFIYNFPAFSGVSLTPKSCGSWGTIRCRCCRCRRPRRRSGQKGAFHRSRSRW